MEINGKEIKDACSECCEILQCELFLDGHGIRRERTRIAEMIGCQMNKRQQWAKEKKANEQ